MKASATNQLYFLKHLQIVFEVVTGKDINEVLATSHFEWLLDLVAADDSSSGFVAIAKLKKAQVKLCNNLLNLFKTEDAGKYAERLRDHLNKIASQLGHFEQYNDEEQLAAFVKLLHQLATCSQTLGNILTHTKDNITVWADLYFNLVFAKSDSQLQKLLTGIYLEDHEQLASKVEETFGCALDFFRNILQDCSIWQSDMLGFDPSETSNEMLEELITQHIFNEARVHEMLSAIVSKFAILTQQELELLKEDELRFYVQQKDQSNETKGNFLRDKALQVVANLTMRFAPETNSFFKFIIAELEKPELNQADV